MASPAYAVSKYGVIRLCQQRARRWAAQGGRIVSISPGLIATPMGQAEVDTNAMAAAMRDNIPGQRMGTPLDIACAVGFLCPDKATYINGTDLLIDCGVSAGQRVS